MFKLPKTQNDGKRKGVLTMSRWMMVLISVAMVAGMILAGCAGKATTTVTTTATSVTTTTTTVSMATPASVNISPSEDYNPIRTQHTFVAQVKAKDGSLVAGTSVEWLLNRAPSAVGDSVSLAGSGPQKVNNTYGVVKTDSNGEARVTITSTREGDTDVTAYVPGISDPAVHKAFGVKHWVDITANFPDDAINAVGTTISPKASVWPAFIEVSTRCSSSRPSSPVFVYY